MYPDMLDLSANLSPLGMPEEVVSAVVEHAAEWAYYPDPDCTALVRKLSEKWHVPAEQIVCGNGAADLIYRIAAAFRPASAVLCEPGFSEYEKALTGQGCRIRRFSLRASEEFALTDSYLSALSPPPEMAFLCTPHNPTGRCIRTPLLLDIARLCRRQGTVMVCDICFLALSDCRDFPAAALLREGCILLDAFTKTYAMAGLRLGYAVTGDAQTAQRIRQTGQYWSVSAPAQAAGLAALDADGYLRHARRLIAEERVRMTRELTAAGLHVFPSDANFLLFRCPPGLAEALLAEGILVRSCESFPGLGSGFCRIAIRLPEENDRFLTALRRILHG